MRAPKHHPLPPGPGAGIVTQSVALHRDPLGMLRRLRGRYGDVFTLRLATEGAVVVVCDPLAVPRLVPADPRLACAGSGRRRILPQATTRSVLGADGEAHARARRRVASVFTAGALDARRDEMAAIAERHVAAWPRGRPFTLLPRLRAIVDEVFARIVVGVDDGDRARALGDAVQHVTRTPGNPPLSPAGEGDGLVGALVDGAYRRRRRRLVELLEAEIAAHRSAGDRDARTLLGAVLADDPARPTAELVDEILPLLLAGQEPPAAALAWVLDRLGREPELADRYLAAGDEDPFRHAVVREALRIRPAVVALMRPLRAPLEVAGHRLPAGAATMLPLPVLHHDPRVFSDPERFDVDRLAPGDGEPPPSYLPFGGGARRCLGEPLAHAELGAVVPAILRRVRLRPLWPQPERMVVRATVLVPHRGGLVVASDR